MIGCRDPVCGAHLSRHATKPGYGEPEPLEPAQTMDSQENIDVCLNCPAGTDDCVSGTVVCPLGRPAKKKRVSAAERDEQVLALINAGWVNIEAICDELKICKKTYFDSKRRLRECGKI